MCRIQICTGLLLEIVYEPRDSNFKILCLVYNIFVWQKDNKYVYLLNKILPCLWAVSENSQVAQRKALHKYDTGRW